MRVLLLNGPNLNLLGTRRPEVYGSTTLSELESMFSAWAAAMGASAVGFQSNHEGDLIDRIHDARGQVDGIVFNPGAYTHTSYAIHDAIESVEIPTVEVHISNVEEREPWRRLSAVRPACVHTIYGRGIEGYRWGLRHLAARASWPVETLHYGSEADQIADLRRPVPAASGLAVVVHGGFWRHMWTRDTTDLVAVDLARRGLASLNVEYRRVGTGGGGMRSVEDVAAAVRAALDHLGTERWVITGHSAGAQLAFVAAHELGAEGRGPDLFVSMGGVADLAEAVAHDLGGGAAVDYVGSEDLVRLSPVDLMPPPSPVVAVHGTEDDRVPVSQARSLVDAVTSHGGAAELLLVEHGGHFDHLEPQLPAWTLVAERLMSALES